VKKILPDVKLKELTENDLPFVKEVYDHYILHSTATFHLTPITLEELSSFIPIGHPVYKSYIIYAGGQPCGYCYIARYKNREAYDRTAEVTLYLHPERKGKGIGKEAMKLMERYARLNHIYVLIGIISGDNTESIQFFTRCGFEQCGHLKQVGKKFGKLIDSIFMQKLLA
jgi:L-amino acid N-acyltransferase YncA